jgi:hypothetical protein
MFPATPGNLWQTHSFKLYRLQNSALRATGSFTRRTPTRDLRVALKIANAYDFITKLWRPQTEVLQMSMSVAQHGPVTLVCAGGQACRRWSTSTALRARADCCKEPGLSEAVCVLRTVYDSRSCNCRIFVHTDIWNVQIQGDSGVKVKKSWKVIVSVIVRKKVIVCLILNGYRYRAVWINKYKIIANCKTQR